MVNYLGWVGPQDPEHNGIRWSNIAPKLKPDNLDFREEDTEGPEKYQDINGTEGNGTADRPMEGARYPDTEDINRDGNFDANILEYPLSPI
ncbi:MAG: hypothetical protein QF669_03415 [Candidatus Marinimicrobia bacterium]|nr:hypothetical protein [Candidatus Neomarinimicrobiota bacterium]